MPHRDLRAQRRGQAGIAAMRMEKAVVIFSGGADSVCSAAHLGSTYDLYGITFSYGQRAGREVEVARTFADALGFRQHKIVDIGFMKDLYAGTNVLTDADRQVPGEFDYTIVVPIRNAVFLTIASAWAYTLNAPLVAYGAHTGDENYPDCRPSFARMLEAALNHGEADGIRSRVRRRIEIWSPFQQGLSKSDLLGMGYEILGDRIFETWSCYLGGKVHCGRCESCMNRRNSFATAGIQDRTPYAQPIRESSS